MKRFLLLFAAFVVHALAADEAVPVRTLGRVFEKLKAGEETAIAYFGGSITAAPGFRVKTFQWLKETFPAAKLREINAAIGGTGSDLGDFRCFNDVVSQRPDLVFVEFSINDGSPTNEFRKATIEGIVRQLWAGETAPEIVFLYTTSRTLDHPRVSQPAVAHYYGIPEIDLQPPLVAALKRDDLPKPTPEQLADPKLDWKLPGQVFMRDTVHPNDLGHQIYTDTIVAWLKTQIDAKPSPRPKLGAPLVSDEFAHVKMIAPSAAKLAGEWETLAPDPKNGMIQRFLEGAINARAAGATLDYEFDGTAVAIYQYVQKDGGKYEWTIDDGKSEPGDPAYGGPRGAKHGTVDTAPGPYFPRYHYAMLTCGLAKAKHTLHLRVLEERDKTSTGNRLLIGYLMIGGL